MASIPKLDVNSLQQICDVIGDTAEGLSGSELAKMLKHSGIVDVAPEITKRKRLFEALFARQEKDSCANNVFAFVQNVMDPIRYTATKEVFEKRRERLNLVLAFRGYQIGTDGKAVIVQKVNDLDEAHQRANKLKAELNKRRVHPKVFHYCKSELLQENHFHAVFEAVKGIADRIREMTGLSQDGADLLDKALSVDDPYLALNTLRTETEKSQQKGFTNLLKGIFGMFRNVHAHVVKIKWTINEEEALDLLTLVSLVHKKLDGITQVKRVS